MIVSNNTPISASINENAINANKSDQLENTFDKVLKDTVSSNEERQENLKKACRDFEAYFMYQMFKEMNKTVSKSDLIPQSQAEKIYEDMLFSEISKEAAEGKGMGLAEMMYNQLSRTYNDIK